MPNIIRLTGDCLFQNFTSKSTTTTTKTFARQNQKNVISGNSSMSALINHLHKTFETHFSSSPSEFSKKHHLQVSAEFFFLNSWEKNIYKSSFPPKWSLKLLVKVLVYKHVMMWWKWVGSIDPSGWCLQKGRPSAIAISLEGSVEKYKAFIITLLVSFRFNFQIWSKNVWDWSQVLQRLIHSQRGYWWQLCL